ncbi:MAG: hypothetical protein R2821_09460 [Flavobacteriaceae bacterium]
MEMLFIKWSLCFAMLLSPIILIAQADTVEQKQSPPVIMEILVGNDGYASQMIINKGFSAIPRLGFFSVTNISSSWGEKMSQDAMNQVNLKYDFLKGMSVFGGVHYTPVTGLRPTTALMYTTGSETLVFMVSPRLIGFNEDGIIEGFAMIEYKPILNENWSIYSRAQGLYNQTIAEGNHARSYLMLRAGLSYKNFSFGLGANWDAFGAERTTKENYGVFLSANLFN